jgi:polysaccharide deacetylase family protein (PEP-CTERM system associated)
VSTCIFSVDVEDWFHILDLTEGPGMDEWARLPSRVDGNFRRMLDLFDQHGARVTCFFLGWIAERHPDLVREAVRRGHEVASHGYAHQLVFEQSPEQFLADIRRAKSIIEDAAGTAVHGYRSPGFSCTADTPWFFDKLEEAGYLYDSSVFPARRGHGGMEEARCEPHVIEGHRLVEFPISVTRVAGRNMCFFGGGYLRLFPYPLVRSMARRVLEDARPVVFYVHPREIDPAHPRLDMPVLRRFKSYVNLRTTETKIHGLLTDFAVTPFIDFIRADRALSGVFS